MHLEPSDAGIRSLLARNLSGPVVMLNLLRLRDTADYSAHPELAPPEPVSGRRAYQSYIDHTEPFLAATGGSILLLGEGGHHLVGPPDERWDLVMLVQQASVQDFLAFAENEGYLAGLGHRVAAVEDSRLLPVTLAQLPLTS